MRALLLSAMMTLSTLGLVVKVAKAADINAPQCSMASEGIYQGYWVKHRIVVGDSVVAGANDMGAILQHLESLRDQGFCR
ncbi:hypothetical protein BDW_02460 [Bdellovibrio bacteriovorus W]|nr:hypothetical protein BDW_02460 [Bdellovibrio bacteriovorus W]